MIRLHELLINNFVFYLLVLFLCQNMINNIIYSKYIQ